METDAYYLILASVRSERHEVIISSVHFSEIEAIPGSLERSELKMMLALMGKRAVFDRVVARTRAEQLVERGFGIADAAHVAIAELCADAFISCDDALVRNCGRHKIGVPAMSPMAFVIEEGLT